MADQPDGQCEADRVHVTNPTQTLWQMELVEVGTVGLVVSVVPGVGTPLVRQSGQAR